MLMVRGDSVVTIRLERGDDGEKLMLLARLAESSARLMTMIPDMDTESNHYKILRIIVEKLGEAAEELEK